MSCHIGALLSLWHHVSITPLMLWHSNWLGEVSVISCLSTITQMYVCTWVVGYHMAVRKHTDGGHANSGSAGLRSSERMHL